MSNTPPVAKILIVGDHGVGKTSFVKLYTTGNFVTENQPTKGFEVSKIGFHTQRGPIIAECWDITGDGLEEAYVGAHAAIIMFDAMSSDNLKNVKKWYNDLMRVCSPIPIVVAGNKCDDGENENHKLFLEEFMKIMSENNEFKVGFLYHDMSVKTNYNHEQPFLQLFRQLTQVKDLVFVSPKVEDKVVEKAEEKVEDKTSEKADK